MSMYACDGCKAITDTDDYPDNWDREGQFFCDVCMAAHWAEGAEMAAEYQRDVIQPAQDRQDIIDAGRGHLLMAAPQPITKE